MTCVEQRGEYIHQRDALVVRFGKPCRRRGDLLDARRHHLLKNTDCPGGISTFGAAYILIDHAGQGIHRAGLAAEPATNLDLQL
jgi:hypothetical protein